MKVAIFGITISLFCTLGVSLMLVETGDYDYDSIQAYRNDLIAFSGEGMVNQSPWILTEVYTPWAQGDAVQVDDDGWLYGSTVEYSYIGESADIKLDPDQKSSVPLSYALEAAEYTQQTGTEWWADIPIISNLGTALGFDPYTYETVAANNWSYTGYRYVFDPTLPFHANLDENGEPVASTVDGSLSLVWYNFNGVEGLSGGLDVYGGNVLLASYTAADIISDYNSGSGYATTYNFDFNGANLTLSIRFDPNVVESGTNLMQAWTQGSWSMAISSVSAGNFLDVTNSAAYSTSVGNMAETFIQIFTFSVPDLDNEWAAMILWLLCGLPMTIALLCVGLRIAAVAKPF